MNSPALIRFALAASMTVVASNAFGALPLGSNSLASGDGLTVLWKGRTHSLEDIEAKADAKSYAGAIGQLERYSAWVDKHDYHVALTDDLRVILVAGSKKAAQKHLDTVAETLATFDALFAPPDRSDSDETFRDGEWGVREHAPDSEPVVLIELEKGKHYQTLLTALGDADPDQETWAIVHASEPGFDDTRTMTTGWQAAPAGYEIGDVWRSKNELVNRLSRLLLYRSFGPQPHWLNQAAGWTIEQQVVGDIYCFPHRAEFVGVEEHAGWRPEIHNQYKSKKAEPFQLSDFAEWESGTFERGYAAAAWGFVQFLAQEEPNALPALAEANRVAYKAGFTVDLGDGNWETNPSFQVTPETQLAVLQKEAGDDVLGDATDFFRKWKKSRPLKASSKGGKRR